MLDDLNAISARLEHRALVRDLDAIGPFIDGLTPDPTPGVATRARLAVRIIRTGRGHVASILDRAAIAIAPDHVVRGHGISGR